MKTFTLEKILNELVLHGNSNKEEKKLLCNFIEFSIQKSCSMRLKAIWRSQNYLPFTVSLEWIAMKRGIKTLKASLAKFSRKKTSLLYDNSEPGLLIFPLHKRESLSVTAPGNVYFTCTSLTCCSNGSHVQVFELHTCLCLGAIEVVGAGNQLQQVSFGHKGNKVSMSVRGACVNSQSTSVAF